MTLQPAALLFDLDGTLLDRDTSFAALIQAQYEAFAAQLDRVPAPAFVRRVVELDDHGYAEKALVYRTIVEEFNLPADLSDQLTAHFHQRYTSFSQCFPEVPSVLADLRSRRIKLGIITNGSTHMQQDKIRRLGVAELIDEVLISEREGVRKPDRRIFERALERLGVDAMKAWFVGDHPIADVKGAFDAGLVAIWRRVDYWKPPDVPCRQIDSLDDLLHFLG